MIYFAQVNGDGPIKIGFTSKPWLNLRMKSLRTFCPYPIAVLGVMPGEASQERALHRRFKLCKVRGEWFRPEPELVQFIAENCNAADLLNAFQPRDEAA